MSDVLSCRVYARGPTDRSSVRSGEDPVEAVATEGCSAEHVSGLVNMSFRFAPVRCPWLLGNSSASGTSTIMAQPKDLLLLVWVHGCVQIRAVQAIY
jgi:hypothetical protein